MKSLSDLVIAELAQVYEIEHRLIAELPHLCSLTSVGVFHDALVTMLRMSRSHLVQLEALFEAFGTEMILKSCEPVKLLFLETEERASQFPTSPIMDDCILSMLQKVVGYKLNCYNSLYAWSGRLGSEEAVDVLAEILAEEYSVEEILQLQSFDLVRNSLHGGSLLEDPSAEDSDFPIHALSETLRTGRSWKIGEHPRY